MYSNSVETILSRNLSLISKVEELQRRALDEVKHVECDLLGLGHRVLAETTSAISVLKSMCDTNVDIADSTIVR
jgi:hypothetical protein